MQEVDAASPSQDGGRVDVSFQWTAASEAASTCIYLWIYVVSGAEEKKRKEKSAFSAALDARRRGEIGQWREV